MSVPTTGFIGSVYLLIFVRILAVFLSRRIKHCVVRPRLPGARCGVTGDKRAYWYRWSSVFVLSVRLSVGNDRACILEKMADLIKVSFGVVDRVGPKNGEL